MSSDGFIAGPGDAMTGPFDSAGSSHAVEDVIDPACSPGVDVPPRVSRGVGSVRRGGYLLSLVLLDMGMTAPGLRASNPLGRDRISSGVMAEVLRGGRAVRSIAI